jgi:hypothetical protein
MIQLNLLSSQTPLLPFVTNTDMRDFPQAYVLINPLQVKKLPKHLVIGKHLATL